MRLTTRTNLALRTLMVCAVNPDRIVRKSEVAERINASENHLAQVVNQLGQIGLIHTLRGRNGGFVLARPAEEISVGSVFRAFEADLPFMECFTDENTCPLKGVCRIGPHLRLAVEAFYVTLDPLMLSDLVDCNDGLEAILSMAGDTRKAQAAGCRQSAVLVPA
jgi:Rrf2 family transcriptional regulator, nitric oxide-sensitive transcriptional repressor